MKKILMHKFIENLSIFVEINSKYMSEIKKTRGTQRVTKLVEEQVYFRESLEMRFANEKKFVVDSFNKLREEIRRLSRGQKQLVDWTGMVFNCYIPKEFCLLNLTLMGMPISEETFDMYASKNMYNKPIQKDGINLYNFKNVFKFFLFNFINKPIKELRSIGLRKGLPDLLEKQSQIMAKSILKLNPDGTFFFDAATMASFEKEVYGDKKANEPQKKASDEETNEKQ